MSREEKGGSTASEKATSIAAVGLFVLRVRVKVVTIVWVLNSSSFQNRRNTLKWVKTGLECLK